VFVAGTRHVKVRAKFMGAFKEKIDWCLPKHVAVSQWLSSGQRMSLIQARLLKMQSSFSTFFVLFVDLSIFGGEAQVK
jgi:hypothetical protein